MTIYPSGTIINISDSNGGTKYYMNIRKGELPRE